MREDGRGNSTADSTLTHLVAGAAKGDDGSWETLVQRFSGLIRAVARNCGLSPSDAYEIEQVTWVRLAEHIHTIDQPERVGAWLTTTARRECWKHCRRGGRYVYSDDVTQFDRELVPEAAVDKGLLDDERQHVLSAALCELPERQRSLLCLLLEQPDISYTELSRVLDMPIGSIGPTRARAVLTLRRHMTRVGLGDAG